MLVIKNTEKFLEVPISIREILEAPKALKKLLVTVRTKLTY